MVVVVVETREMTTETQASLVLRKTTRALLTSMCTYFGLFELNKAIGFIGGSPRKNDSLLSVVVGFWVASTIHHTYGQSHSYSVYVLYIITGRRRYDRYLYIYGVIMGCCGSCKGSLRVGVGNKRPRSETHSAIMIPRASSDFEPQRWHQLDQGPLSWHGRVIRVLQILYPCPLMYYISLDDTSPSPRRSPAQRRIPD